MGVSGTITELRDASDTFTQKGYRNAALKGPRCSLRHPASGPIVPAVSKGEVVEVKAWTQPWMGQGRPSTQRTISGGHRTNPDESRSGATCSRERTWSLDSGCGARGTRQPVASFTCSGREAPGEWAARGSCGRGSWAPYQLLPGVPALGACRGSGARRCAPGPALRRSGVGSTKPRLRFCHVCTWGVAG